ncbi:MAG TPA: DUF2284 domain-containing protein [Anaerohalosphaeraceae bacterium]|nr:DUF2284 domain-containing protein [Anaerohalosphaeraceae bacterium]HOL32161.1 DUF2284 domain-containing protein [Anaerohalosphaeraceae bacterium]HOM77147.1 DUF2284 domain-containing protein [Anaerohalosphaeraceae bacterium]HPC65115.1 DUF2284 domain-containing protein [Anaerohalosphaeraceae bacterium]HPO71004.1 DUF2284 domain-containing protein [Anaerohalosphaeraceae bacterium]
MAAETISNEELVKLAEALDGATQAKVIAASDVQTAAWVRLKCQYGCDGYGQCLVCPPYSPSPEQTQQVLDGYRRAVLVHFKDWNNTKPQMVKLERTVFLKGAWKAFAMGAGPCRFCAVCTLQIGQCRHAEQARPAMEACGIDVFTTARKAGFPIEVVKNRRQCPNFYGLLLVD